MKKKQYPLPIDLNPHLKRSRNIFANLIANLLLIGGFAFIYFNSHTSNQVQISSQNTFFLPEAEKGNSSFVPEAEKENNSTSVPEREKEKGSSSVFETDNSFFVSEVRGNFVFDRRTIGSTSHKMMPSDREGPSAFLTQGGVVDQKDARFRILCRLRQSQQCFSKTIAEQIDLVWAFSPIYSIFPDKMPELYITHVNYIGYLKSFGIQTILLEAIYPGQNFKVTKAGNDPWEIQLKIEDYLYYRENFVNVAIRKTKHLNYDYIIWLDSHQIFLNPYWWEDGIEKMARYPTVSFFHDLVHVKYAGDNSTMREGSDQNGVQYVYQQTSDMNYWVNGETGIWLAWNGNAVGVRREIYDQIEFIADHCIQGCCDCVFNAATMTSYWNLMDSFDNYGREMQPWIKAARKVLGGENGVVRGKLLHLYHEHIRYKPDSFKALVKDSKLNLWNEIYRDENFTIHLKKDSYLKRVLKKPGNDLPIY